MKITTVNQLKYNNQLIRHSKNVSNSVIYEQEDEKQKVFASNLCFRSSVAIKALYNDYKWFINNDKIPAINSLLKIEATPEKINELIAKILENDEDSFELIDSIVKQPRESNNIFNRLRSKLPHNSTLPLIFIDNNPIRTAYKKYIESSYQNATSAE